MSQRLHTFRLVVGGLVMVLWVIAILGFDWDLRWHFLIGRDGFWTPPHWLFYSTITLAGTLCLSIVLLETVLYYRGYPGINDRTTSMTLFIFHGSLGFILAGYGMVVMLVSAPLDDYWHRIYGIDLSIWTPFHVMLLLGLLIGSLGLIYVFAALANTSHKINLFSPALLGLALASASLLTRYFFLMGETLTGTLTIVTLKLPAYSLAVVGPTVLILVALRIATGSFGLATLTGLLFLGLKLLSHTFVGWGIDELVAAQHRNLKSVLVFKDFGFIDNLYPAYLPVVGLSVDIVFYMGMWVWSEHPPLRLVRTVSLASLISGLLLFLFEKPWEAYNNTLMRLMDSASAANNGNPIAASLLKQQLTNQLFYPDYWAALPLIVVLALAVGGLGGIALGTALHHTNR